MKVLHITPMYPSEANPGFGSFVKSQIDSLRPHVDIDLLVLPGAGGISPYLKSIPLIKKKLKEPFDILHIHFGHVATMVKMLYTGKKPIITSYCGSDLLGKVSDTGFTALKGKNLAKLNRQASKKDYCSIVKTEELGREIKGYSNNIKIIPNGVDSKVFTPMNTESCRKKLGLDMNKPTILFPADPANKIKNFKLLEDAIAGIAGMDIQLISFDSNNKVAHEQVPLYINAADLVILTSHHEGSSNVIKESMACNKIVFSTDVGDSKWLLEGVNGAKIIENEPEPLTVAIEEFFSTKTQLTPNSRDIFLKKGLDTETIANKIMDVYRSAAASKA